MRGCHDRLMPLRSPRGTAPAQNVMPSEARCQANRGINATNLCILLILLKNKGLMCPLSWHSTSAKYNCDPDVWAKEYVAKLNAKEAEELKPIQVSFSPKSLISKNHQYSYNVGYLFLQNLYYSLGLDKICKKIAARHEFEYDLNDILAKLIYGRILSPCSKTATLRFSKKLLEQPNFDEHRYTELLM